MADRIFTAALLAVILGYTAIAFALISAPFQYDPLGPESWPRILGMLGILCCAFILARPEVHRFDATRQTVGRLGFVVALLMGYAWGYETLGFVLSTALFCWALATFLGIGWVRAGIFGAATGIIGWFVGTLLLDLNLPEGVLRALS